MPIGSGTTGNGDQVGGRLSRQGLPPSPLHSIMQHQVEPTFCIPMGDILHRGLSNRKGLGNLD